MTDGDEPMMVAYDVECHACANDRGAENGAAVHVVWLRADDDLQPGDSIGYAHREKKHACGLYCEHRIVAELSGLKQRPRSAVGGASA